MTMIKLYRRACDVCRTRTAGIFTSSTESVTAARKLGWIRVPRYHEREDPRVRRSDTVADVCPECKDAGAWWIVDDGYAYGPFHSEAEAKERTARAPAQVVEVVHARPVLDCGQWRWERQLAYNKPAAAS